MKQKLFSKRQQPTLYLVDDTLLTLFGELTGLPFTIYLNSVGKDWQAPAVIAKDDDTVYLTAEDNPRVISPGVEVPETFDLEKFKKWVLLNKEIITDFWNSKISYEDVVHNLKKL